MFSNVESKLKTLAKVNFACGILIAVIAPIYATSVNEKLFAAGLSIGCVYLLSSLFGSWFIYAFAELLEETRETNRLLRTGFTDEIGKEVEEQRRVEEEKHMQQEKQEIERREKQRQEAERKQEEKRVQEARIAAYWEKHAEEHEALTAKREAAQAILKERKGLSREQREALEKVIIEINAELTKDREG